MARVVDDVALVGGGCAQQLEQRLLRLSSGKMKSYAPFSMSVGMVTRGAKLTGSESGGRMSKGTPPLQSRPTLIRSSTASRGSATDAP